MTFGAADWPPSADLAFFISTSFVGSAVRGVTGFGTAIVIIAIWCLLSIFGYDLQGGIRRLIHVESVCHASGAIALIFVTSVRAHAWGDVLATMVPCSMIGTQLGALLLLRIAPRPLELTVGLVLVFVLCLRVADTTMRTGAKCWGERAVQPAVELEALGLDRTDLSLEAGDDEGAALLAPAGENAKSNVAGEPGSTSHDAEAWLGRRYIVWGAGGLAGLASGLLGGLSAVGGPPTIMMYQALRASKEAVRASSAIASLASAAVRLPTYIVTGQLPASDAYIYLAAAVSGQAGLWLGVALAPRVAAARFDAALTALVAVCACVLLARAAGIGGN